MHGDCDERNAAFALGLIVGRADRLAGGLAVALYIVAGCRCPSSTRCRSAPPSRTRPRRRRTRTGIRTPGARPGKNPRQSRRAGAGGRPSGGRLPAPATTRPRARRQAAAAARRATGGHPLAGARAPPVIRRRRHRPRFDRLFLCRPAPSRARRMPSSSARLTMAMGRGQGHRTRTGRPHRSTACASARSTAKGDADARGDRPRVEIERQVRVERARRNVIEPGGGGRAHPAAEIRPSPMNVASSPAPRRRRRRRPGLRRAGPAAARRGKTTRVTSAASPALSGARRQDRGGRVLLVRLPALQRLRAALEAWVKKLPRRSMSLPPRAGRFRDGPRWPAPLFRAREAWAMVEAMRRPGVRRHPSTAIA